LALIPGTRLGVYDITAQIGEGGMAKCFGRPTRSEAPGLPPSLAADSDRLARLQREAEVLASLNPPNIAAVQASGGNRQAPRLT